MENFLIELYPSGRCILRVRCSLIGPQAKEFQKVVESLIDDLPRDVMVDLEGAEMINSVALSALLRLHGELEERRGRFSLLHVSPTVLATLELTRVDDLFEVRG